MGEARRSDGRHVLAAGRVQAAGWPMRCTRLTSPFAATYAAWLKDNHAKLHQLLSEPHEPVCTNL